MKSEKQIKEIVKEKYGEIARQRREVNAPSCCGTGCGCSDEVAVMAERYDRMEGYVPDADLGLGCGIPTDVAALKRGDTVLDLGCGAGNDVFVARRIVGDEGTVIGVDMTEAMIAKADANKKQLGFHNVEFRLGEIEQLPVQSGTIDVVLSNCVLNLVPNKKRAFEEILRVLKPGGHFSISDIVLVGTLPPAILEAAEMYAGCVSGAMNRNDYLQVIRSAGFSNVEVKKEKTISIPDRILREYLTQPEFEVLRESGAILQSITVFGKKA